MKTLIAVIMLATLCVSSGCDQFTSQLQAATTPELIENVCGGSGGSGLDK